MELQYYGANCIRINTKKAQIVIDDNLAQLGLKSVTKPTDISLRTSQMFPAHPEARFTAEAPGEYEIADVIIHGIAARAHMDEEGKSSAVIYTIKSEDITVVVLGHIYPELSDDQLEEIGVVQVAITPVGGNGYTMDGVGALQVIKKLEPKLIIPTHYEDKQIRYEVPMQPLAEGLKGLALEPAETVSKLKIKPTDLGTDMRLIVLER